MPGHTVVAFGTLDPPSHTNTPPMSSFVHPSFLPSVPSFLSFVVPGILSGFLVVLVGLFLLKTTESLNPGASITGAKAGGKGGHPNVKYVSICLNSEYYTYSHIAVSIRPVCAR